MCQALSDRSNDRRRYNPDRAECAYFMLCLYQNLPNRCKRVGGPLGKHAS